MAIAPSNLSLQIKLNYKKSNVGFWFLVRGENWSTYQGKNLPEQSREPTNSTHVWHQLLESNPGHIVGRRVLSPLHQPREDTSLYNVTELTYLVKLTHDNIICIKKISGVIIGHIVIWVQRVFILQEFTSIKVITQQNKSTESRFWGINLHFHFIQQLIIRIVIPLSRTQLQEINFFDIQKHFGNQTCGKSAIKCHVSFSYMATLTDCNFCNSWKSFPWPTCPVAFTTNETVACLGTNCPCI